jgi:DNA-binding ferritin-like protein
MLAKIANYLRAMQLFYHASHNLVKGAVFNQDHGTFASFYDQCESDYDSVIERAINIEGPQVADLSIQMKEIYNNLKGKPTHEVKENKEYFLAGLEMEKQLCQMIEECCAAKCSIGTEQAIGNVADKSEVRQYLISQRIK